MHRKRRIFQGRKRLRTKILVQKFQKKLFSSEKVMRIKSIKNGLVEWLKGRAPG
jgi:hypothetical protein